MDNMVDMNWTSTHNITQLHACIIMYMHCMCPYVCTCACLHVYRYSARMMPAKTQFFVDMQDMRTNKTNNFLCLLSKFEGLVVTLPMCIGAWRKACRIDSWNSAIPSRKCDIHTRKCSTCKKVWCSRPEASLKPAYSSRHLNKNGFAVRKCNLVRNWHNQVWHSWASIPTFWKRTSMNQFGSDP